MGILKLNLRANKAKQQRRKHIIELCRRWRSWNEEQAKLKVRPALQRYKNFKSEKKLVLIEQMLREVKLKQDKGGSNEQDHLPLATIHALPNGVL